MNVITYRTKHEEYNLLKMKFMFIDKILTRLTKKLSVVLGRYEYVVSKYVGRGCIEIDANSICIY